MAVGFSSYEIARSGMMVSERGLNVTGHNISNVNTPGYVRQQVIITSGPYKKDGPFDLGLGADIEQIRQIRHTFLDNIYRNESQSFGYWEARNKTFQDIQAILGEPMEKGMQDVMNQFWDSWQELSKSPDSLTIRAIVRQRGESLIHYVNHLGAQLDRLQNDLDNEISVKINEINSLTRQINEYNLAILKAENYGDKANDYKDQRNVLIDKLSYLIDIDAYETQDGQINISSGGYFLVSKGMYQELEAVERKTGDLFITAKIKGTDMEIPFKSGVLKGLMEARGEVSAAKGSEENGSPYDKIDLVFAIDTSAGNVDAATYAGIRDNIDNIVKQYKDKGIDVRLGIIEFDADSVSAPTFYSSSIADIEAFKDHIDGPPGGWSGDSGTESMSLDALQDASEIAYRMNAVRQVVLVTGAPADDGTYSLDGILRTLNERGIVTSVIADDATLGSAFKPLTEGTGGFFHDDGAAMADTMTAISNEIRDLIYNNVHDTMNIIPDIRNRLNLLINALAREINSLHREGFTLDGNAGMDFFVPIDPAYPLEMGNIQLNPALANLNNIVASGDMNKGDNTIAKRIAELRNTPIMGSAEEMMSFDDFYRAAILHLGNRGSEASRVSTDQAKLVESADNYRQSITNVSLDEEMANMMKYQFAYGASSKVLNVIDEMINTIINRMAV